mmetsp:Transcript_14256/g.21274  ORF Transcript_14256/g.21274 Transcript_14256/m.21274 type:complete len:109 (-) Transcript_14256:1928-2254(-)
MLYHLILKQIIRKKQKRIRITFDLLVHCGIPVTIPTPLTRPSRNNILIPGRMYSGRCANSKRTFARLPGRSTIPSVSSFALWLGGKPKALLFTIWMSRANALCLTFNI